MLTPCRIPLVSVILLILLGSICAQAQMTVISEPVSKTLIQHANGAADINVQVSAVGVPLDGGVEIVLDMGTPKQKSVKLRALPYVTTFEDVPVGEHTVDAFVIDAADGRVGASDHVDRIGVGDIIVAVGDSITLGEVDDYAGDNFSADGRNGPVHGYGGYEPILNDVLTSALGRPFSVPNEGVSGENTSMAKNRITSIISRHPTALTWFLAYGTNDANGGMSASTFKKNLQYLITEIQSSIPGASVYLPRVFYHDETVSGAQYIAAYNAAIADLTRTMPNVCRGADLRTLFQANHALYPNHLNGQYGSWLARTPTHHPNGVGAQKMSMLWTMAYLDRAVLVSDGVFDSVGDLDVDRVTMEALKETNVGHANLLEICDHRGKGSPPPGTTFVGDWRVKLKLTGAPDFGGPAPYVNLRVDDTGLLPAGGSWKKVYLARDGVVLQTFRGTKSGDSHVHYLSAKVDRPGVIAPVYVPNMAGPTTTMHINPSVPNGSNGWYITVPRVTFTSVDVFGASAKVYYAWDDGSESRYSSGINAPEGKHTLYYHGVDDSDNSEEVRSCTMRTDTSAPTTPTVSLSTPSVKRGQAVTISWHSTDSESGIDKYVYAIGTGPGRSNVRGWTGVGLRTSISWKPNGADGAKYYISVKCRNRAGRYSPIGVSDSLTVASTATSNLRPSRPSWWPWKNWW